MMERTKPLTIEEFMRRYDETPFEILDGEWFLMTPASFKRSRIAKRVYDAVLHFLDAHPIGEVFFETVFILLDQPNWVGGSRVPDVMFVRRETLERYAAQAGNHEDRPLVLVPDLVVEVISPNDRYSEVNRKIDAYLNDGVQLIWLPDPQLKRVMVYEAGREQPVTLTIGMTLTDGDVLPGFELGVDVIFS